MEWLVIGIAALLTSMLTLFSGFGLGTLLMPVMALFFAGIALMLVAVLWWRREPEPTEKELREEMERMINSSNPEDVEQYYGHWPE